MNTHALSDVTPFVVREESLLPPPRLSKTEDGGASVDPSSPEFTALMMKAFAKAKRIAFERKEATAQLSGTGGDAANG